MITLRHIHNNSYTEFIERLVERFDRKDLEFPFRDFAHLRHTGSLEAYISEFQRLAVMVIDISKTHLIMLFIGG